MHDALAPDRKPGQHAATLLIAAAAFAVLLLGAWEVGAHAGHPERLPAPPMKHGVAFRLRQMERRS